MSLCAVTFKLPHFGHFVRLPPLSGTSAASWSTFFSEGLTYASLEALAPFPFRVSTTSARVSTFFSILARISFRSSSINCHPYIQDYNLAIAPKSVLGGDVISDDDVNIKNSVE